MSNLPSKSSIVLGHSDLLTVICLLNKGKVDAKYRALQYVGRYHISDTTDKAMIRAQYTIYIFTQYTKATSDMRSTQYEICKQLDVPSMNKKQLNTKYVPKKMCSIEYAVKWQKLH